MQLHTHCVLQCLQTTCNLTIKTVRHEKTLNIWQYLVNTKNPLYLSNRTAWFVLRRNCRGFYAPRTRCVLRSACNENENKKLWQHCLRCCLCLKLFPFSILFPLHRKSSSVRQQASCFTRSPPRTCWSPGSRSSCGLFREQQPTRKK